MIGLNSPIKFFCRSSNYLIVPPAMEELRTRAKSSLFFLDNSCVEGLGCMPEGGFCIPFPPGYSNNSAITTLHWSSTSFNIITFAWASWAVKRKISIFFNQFVGITRRSIIVWSLSLSAKAEYVFLVDFVFPWVWNSLGSFDPEGFLPMGCLHFPYFWRI